MEKLSAVVPTYNEQAKIGDCLRSLRWADELLVVDSNSTDGTVDAARELADRVEVHPFEGFAAQKNWCLDRASHRWVLLVDADEVCSPELRDEITRVLARPSDAGYWIPRVNYFLGKRMRGCGWGRQKVLRLFDRERGRYPDRLVHETLALDGSAGYLNAPLFHRPYESLDDYWVKFHRYARLSAEEMRAQGRKCGIGSVLSRPPARFIRMYFLQLGFVDGAHGLVLCGLAALQVYAKYATLWELNRENEDSAHRHRDHLEGRRSTGSGPGQGAHGQRP